MDLILISWHINSGKGEVRDQSIVNPITEDKNKLVFPIQDYLTTIINLCKGEVTVRSTDDYKLQDDIFGELPFLIMNFENRRAKFITRDNIPKFIRDCTTINDWLSEKQQKSCEWIEHQILDINPAYRLYPPAQPAKAKLFLTKFYRINSEFDTFSIHDGILKLLSEKLADKTWFYDRTKVCSADFLAYFWIKQQMLLGEMGEIEDEAKNLLENYENLLKFVDRMDNLLKELKNGTPPAMAHIQWLPEEKMSEALESYKQRDAVFLDSKIRQYRENWYFLETRRARYIRLAISLGVLGLFFLFNRPKKHHPFQFIR